SRRTAARAGPGQLASHNKTMFHRQRCACRYRRSRAGSRKAQARRRASALSSLGRVPAGRLPARAPALCRSRVSLWANPAFARLRACVEITRAQSSPAEDKTKLTAIRGALDEPMTVTNIADPGQLTRDADAALERIAAARAEIGGVIFGQERVVDLSLTTLLAGGHGLLIGVPGLAKTKLVETLGIVVGLDALRVQFTPDLMPTDILGSEVMEEGHDGKRGFRFIKGPIFAQLLMADEINRASPRTQSALLQAMQEHHVTVAGARYDLPRPFHVLATQNPLEQEGAYPLPEAQLDRFLLQIDVGYPDRTAERRILIETTGEREARPKPVMSAEDLMTAQRLVRRAPIGDRVVEAILDL